MKMLAFHLKRAKISKIICDYYGDVSDIPLSIQNILSKLRTLQTFKEEKPLALV